MKSAFSLSLVLFVISITPSYFAFANDNPKTELSPNTTDKSVKALPDKERGIPSHFNTPDPALEGAALTRRKLIKELWDLKKESFLTTFLASSTGPKNETSFNHYLDEDIYLEWLQNQQVKSFRLLQLELQDASQASLESVQKQVKLHKRTQEEWQKADELIRLKGEGVLSDSLQDSKAPTQVAANNPQTLGSLMPEYWEKLMERDRQIRDREEKQELNKYVDHFPPFRQRREKPKFETYRSPVQPATESALDPESSPSAPPSDKASLVTQVRKLFRGMAEFFSTQTLQRLNCG